jgi:Rad3-related DNA helicase
MAEASCFLRTCLLEGRNIRGSKQDSKCVVLEGTYERQRYSEFFLDWLDITEDLLKDF